MDANAHVGYAGEKEYRREEDDEETVGMQEAEKKPKKHLLRHEGWKFSILGEQRCICSSP